MKVTKELLEKNVVQIEVEVAADKFEEAVNKAFLKNAKKVSVPGFRKGKAPRKLIEKMYGEGVFYDDAMDIIFADTYEKALTEQEIEPIDRPVLDVKQIGKDKDFIYTAKIPVKPEVELSEYKGVEVEKVEYKATQEEVDKEIDNMRERAARIIEVEDKAIENGDIAVIDFEGFVDEVAFEGGKGENHSLTIGSGQFIPGFEEQLIGKNKGDETDVKVTFPEEYQAEELAGKEAVFKVKINAIKAKEYPELDDDFAKDVSEYDTLEELKAKTLERLQETADNRTKREQENKIIDAVVAKAQVEIPDVMVDRQVDELVQDAGYRMSMQGLKLEQYLEYTGGNMEQFRDSLKERALGEVKARLTLEKIAKEQGFTVSDEDIENEIEKIAKQYNMETDKVRELLGENGLEKVSADLIMGKTVEYLTSVVAIA